MITAGEIPNLGFGQALIIANGFLQDLKESGGSGGKIGGKTLALQPAHHISYLSTVQSEP